MFWPGFFQLRKKQTKSPWFSAEENHEYGAFDITDWCKKSCTHKTRHGTYSLSHLHLCPESTLKECTVAEWYVCSRTVFKLFPPSTLLYVQFNAYFYFFSLDTKSNVASKKRIIKTHLKSPDFLQFNKSDLLLSKLDAVDPKKVLVQAADLGWCQLITII